MSTCAVLFAKKPAPGAVKTRLQSHLSASEAARLYEALLLDCAIALHETQAAAKVVAFAPAHAEDALHTLLAPIGTFEYVPQPEGNLGQRMESLMQWAFARGAERVVIIGSDSPSLPAAYIDEGIALLHEKEVVLGPSTDGGYYLVGQAKRRKPDIPRRGLEHRDGIRANPSALGNADPRPAAALVRCGYAG